MKRDMNYLEEFLFSAQEKIDNLKVTTEPVNVDDYKYLIVDFDKMTYRIPMELVFNFCNIYHRLNRDELDDVEVEVNPYANLGSIKEKDLVIDSSIITTEDGISELLEKIVSRIYEKYNFLILPAEDEDVDEINVSDYVLSRYESHSLQNKSQGQNLYSIGFKIKAEMDKVTEYFPFKIYFRIFEKKNQNDEKGEIGVDIAEEFNGLAKSTKINVLTARRFTQREKASLRKKFENHEFDEDKEKISSNIESIIHQILLHIEKYVSDFDNAPKWFIESELGKFIRNALISNEEPNIRTTASFRYITQTPLPYSYVDVRFRNNFGTDTYQIKMASSSNKNLNDTLNICPICGETINSLNKIVASNEYVDKFLGCQKCMKEKCSICDSVWSSKKTPTPINRKVNGKFYYMAGAIKSSLSFVDDNFGKNLCSAHSRKCFNLSCNMNVYSPSMVEKCSNSECEKTYCLEHVDVDLYKCETSVCANSDYPNRYCKDCKDRFLNTCSFCGKTMCKNCSRTVMVQNSLGEYEEAIDEYICLDCLNLITSGNNLEINKANKALVALELNTYHPKSINYLKKYGDNDNQYIDNSIAMLAFKSYKPEGWENDSSVGRYYYKEEELQKCNICEQYFKYTQTLKYDRQKHYCDDCVARCSACDELSPINNGIMYKNKFFCKDCYKTKWLISDLNSDDALFNENKEEIVNKVFANPALVEDYKVVPALKASIYLCPETKLNVDYKQTKVCECCNVRYSLSNFAFGSKTCKLCDSLNNFDYNENKELLIEAFYNPSYGDVSKFRAYCTLNSLLISYGDNREVISYYFDKKKGKYVKRLFEAVPKEGGITDAE